ncbi:hypothetical protein KEH59_08150 [Burkholderia contaminans]|uniref:hypothetical protein n=1 Tax=Burkholderia contaminans TaxID=488447 RepID=UPI001BA6B01B|nr:hypothetical protein [Burkholderia contaminans]QUN45689.1 hypothetical protein KEH59_08150 [Burkholderia contaminans]
MTTSLRRRRTNQASGVLPLRMSIARGSGLNEGELVVGACMMDSPVANQQTGFHHPEQMWM